MFVIQTVGELFLSPVGLATTTALAPKQFASQAMVLWLLAISTGQGLDDNNVTIAGHPAEYMAGYDLARILEGHDLNVLSCDGENLRELYAAIQQDRKSTV